jgi:hypothetical protein
MLLAYDMHAIMHTFDTCIMRYPGMTSVMTRCDILVHAYFFIFQVDTCCNYLQNYLEHAFQIVVVK